MKSPCIITILVVSCLTLTGFAEKLTVEIKGLKHTEGQIQVGIYDKEEGFPILEKRLMGKIIKPISESANVVEFDVPAGTYAVVAMHDENGNGKMDRRKIIKFPIEPYGFSNDARGKMGPPPFKKAAFTIDGKDVTVTVTVK